MVGKRLGKDVSKLVFGVNPFDEKFLLGGPKHFAALKKEEITTLPEGHCQPGIGLLQRRKNEAGCLLRRGLRWRSRDSTV